MLPLLANYFGITIDELMGFKLGEFFADLIMEAHLDFDCIVGMAYHGISFAAATATILANKYGITVNYCSDRKVPDSRGRQSCSPCCNCRQR